MVLGLPALADEPSPAKPRLSARAVEHSALHIRPPPAVAGCTTALNSVRSHLETASHVPVRARLLRAFGCSELSFGRLALMFGRLELSFGELELSLGQV